MIFHPTSNYLLQFPNFPLDILMNEAQATRSLMVEQREMKETQSKMNETLQNILDNQTTLIKKQVHCVIYQLHVLSSV
jgi:hypothetical protein